MIGNKSEKSIFICQECGCIALPLARPAANKRERGHIKDLWCFKCKKQVKTLEIRSGDCYTTQDGVIIY